MGITVNRSLLAWHNLPNCFGRSRWAVDCEFDDSPLDLIYTGDGCGGPDNVANLELRASATANAANRPEVVIAWAAMDSCDVVIAPVTILMVNQSATGKWIRPTT
jgi:hypothetical protein